MSVAELSQIATLLTRIESNFGISSAKSAGVSVNAYDVSVGAQLSNFLQLSNDIGDVVVKVASLTQAAFGAMRNILVQAESMSSSPTGPQLAELLKPLANSIEAVQTYKNSNRSSCYFNHLSTIAESIGSLGWVSVPEKPCPYIESMRDAGVFYSNRILKDYKGKANADVHVSWVRTWSDMLNQLLQFVKANHTTGLTWSKKSPDVSDRLNMQDVLARLDVLANSNKPSSRTSLLITSNNYTTSGSGASGSKAVDEYHAAITLKVQRFVEISKELSAEVGEAAVLVQHAFAKLAHLIQFASEHGMTKNFREVADFVKLADAINSVISFRESRRTSNDFNHLSALSSSISALGWVQVTPAPTPFVKEMSDAGKFYTNKILVQYRKTDQKQVEWVNEWMAILSSLESYVKQHHTTGLSWNQSAPPPPSGTAPPPAPPPPPPPPAMDDSGNDQDAAKRAELFKSLNQGEGITSRLRKVDDSEKTHKNPALRNAAQVKASPPPVAPKPGAHKPASSPSKVIDRPPVLELSGNKWTVEYQRNNRNIVIDKTQLKQTVYVYRCENCTIQVKGKINGITLDSCKKTALVFDELISTVDLVNCSSVQVQCLQMVSTVSIDKCDGVQVYLSEETSKKCRLVSAKSSEMNVCVTQPDGGLTEFALPEQYNHEWSGKGYRTQQSDI